MADKKTSAEDPAGALTGAELVRIVQSGSNKKATVAQFKTPLTVTQSDAGTMLAGVPSFPIDGQTYLITNLGITGVDHIRTVGMVDYSNPGFYKFNNNCEAYITSLGQYVQCDYDLASNDISGEYVLWCADLYQTGTNPPTISKLHKNISGETPTINYDNLGNYSIVFTNDQLVSSDNVDKVSGIIDENGGYFFCYAGDENTFIVNTVKNGSFSDDLLSRTTIKIIVQLK